MKLDLFKYTGEKTTKKVDLSNDIFAISPNDHAIYLDVKQYLASNRSGTHKAKERSEIKGSRRKLRKQKGSGAARVGDIKNPIFRGGGRAFGPRPRDYHFKLNKKVKRLARKSALSYKAKEKNIIVLEDFKFKSPKTKNYLSFLEKLGLNPNYDVKKNPLPWLDTMLNGVEHMNLFEGRATEYSKASTKGTWGEVFA